MALKAALPAVLEGNLTRKEEDTIVGTIGLSL